VFKTPVFFFFGGGVALSKLTNILGFVIIHCWHLQPVFHRMTGSGGTLLLVESLWGKSLRSTLSFVNARFGLLDGEMSLPSPAPQKVQGNLYNYGEFLAFSCISSMNPPQKWPERPSWWWKKIRHDGAQAVCVQVMSTALIYPNIPLYIIHKL